MQTFNRAEIEAAWRRRMDLQDSSNWEGFGKTFTADAVYLESDYEFAGITVMEYAGNDTFSFQEDMYNRHETDKVLAEWEAGAEEQVTCSWSCSCSVDSKRLHTNTSTTTGTIPSPLRVMALRIPQHVADRDPLARRRLQPPVVAPHKLVEVRGDDPGVDVLAVPALWTERQLEPPVE